MLECRHARMRHVKDTVSDGYAPVSIVTNLRMTSV